MKVRGFWEWLVRRDSEGDRGLNNIINWWTIFHLIVALAFSMFTEENSANLARTVALPGSAVLVGLAFGWAGRSAGLFSDKSFSKFVIRYGAPVEGYLYSFQLAILIILIFEAICLAISANFYVVSSGRSSIDEGLNRFVIVFTGSLAVRECWGVILFVNKLTLQYYRLRAQEVEDEEKKAEAAKRLRLFRLDFRGRIKRRP